MRKDELFESFNRLGLTKSFRIGKLVVEGNWAKGNPTPNHTLIVHSEDNGEGEVFGITLTFPLAVAPYTAQSQIEHTTSSLAILAGLLGVITGTVNEHTKKPEKAYREHLKVIEKLGLGKEHKPGLKGSAGRIMTTDNEFWNLRSIFSDSTVAISFTKQGEK